jgi:hypothetical protein
MKTKFAALAMLLIMASALAVNFGLACDQGGCPVPIGTEFEGECADAVLCLIEQYESDCALTTLTADVCAYIWIEGTATEAPDLVINWRIIYDNGMVDVQRLDIPCDGCGDLLKRGFIIDVDQDNPKEECIITLIECLLAEVDVPIRAVEAEVCLRMFDECCDYTVEKWLIAIEGDTAEAILFEWHEIIMNSIVFEGIIGECRGNEMELVYLGEGIYESGLTDVHFYAVFKVNDDPMVRDLQATVELYKTGPMTYNVEIYHSVKNGEFGYKLPFCHTVRATEACFTWLVIDDPLC